MSEALKQHKSRILQKIKEERRKATHGEPMQESIRVVASREVPPLETWPHILNHERLPERPTDVQRHAIPYILAKEDVSVISETGSGKTLCYVLPYIHILDGEDERLLVLVPTRELVAQVAGLFRKHGSIRVVEIVGGKSVDIQRLELSEDHGVVVSTPGRLLDLMDLKCVGRFRYLVVDEVDRLLSSNFREDLDRILEHIEPRTCSYFSATYFEYGGGTRIIMGAIKVSRSIEELFIYLRSSEKMEFVAGLLNDPSAWISQRKKRRIEIKKVVVFVNTIRACERFRLPSALFLHSRMSQREREAVVRRMRAEGEVLVCTDLASRGMDIEGIDLVISCDFPSSIDTYIHRCGRAGRQRSGYAVSLLTEDDRGMFGKLRRLLESNSQEVPGFLRISDDYILD
jgi:superfamily II DNA/RNA helicase